eukprot:COSAG06_NODE_8215_length_2236_cov_2.765739_1_plen_140_part_10
MRTSSDHKTHWCSNSTYQTLFWPKAGLECSIQKTKDWVYGGKPERVGRFFSTVPEGLDTIHCDAWHDDGYSWEPEDELGHGRNLEASSHCGFHSTMTIDVSGRGWHGPSTASCTPSSAGQLVMTGRIPGKPAAWNASAAA